MISVTNDKTSFTGGFLHDCRIFKLIDNIMWEICWALLPLSLRKDAFWHDSKNQFLA
jgi:hypothetical protein